MGRIQKLPFISGCIAAIVTGIVCCVTGLGNQMTYLRMAVMMLVFFILGAYVRHVVVTLLREVRIKKMEDEIEEVKRQKQLKQEQQAEQAAKSRGGHIPDTPFSGMNTAPDNEDEEFKPMTVSRAIVSKLNE